MAATVRYAKISSFFIPSYLMKPSHQAVPTGVKRRGPDSADILSGALRIAMPHFG